MNWYRVILLLAGATFVLLYIFPQKPRLDDSVAFSAYNAALVELTAARKARVDEMRASREELPTRASCEKQHELEGLHLAFEREGFRLLTELGILTLREMQGGRKSDRARLRALQREVSVHRVMALALSLEVIDHWIMRDVIVDLCISGEPPI